MIAIAGYYHDNESSKPTKEKYTSVYVIEQQACAGYLSWNNSLGYRDYTIELPTDVRCLPQPFDIGRWQTTSIGNFALATINASIFDDFKNFTNVDKLWELTRNTILPTTDITFPQLQDEWPNVHNSPVHPDCRVFYDDPKFKLVETGFGINGVKEMMPADDSKFWDGQIVVVGLIQGAGTGMTGLGIALQAFVVLVCCISMFILLWKPLPLLGEWPGQWLLLASGLDRRIVAGNLKGVSAGGGRASGDTTVWLVSSDPDSQESGREQSRSEEGQAVIV
jgi:hypothetical protein